MAQAGVVLDKDQFTCSVCLDVLREPVTIPCGHSYCSECIRNFWDQDDYLGVFTCPQCRQNFSPRPALARSTLLADVVDRFKQSGLQELMGGEEGQQEQYLAKADYVVDRFKQSGLQEFMGGEEGQQEQNLAEADDVECDVCPGRKNKAVNSCLVCLASYCELHVRPHHHSAVFKKHKLVSASKRLQESVCPRHDKLLEVYCRTDKQCICSMCLTDDHKGHDTALVEVEIQTQQRQLGEMKLKSQQSIQQREKEAQELRQAIFSLNRSARLAAETSDSVFTDHLRFVELKRFEVRELIKAQQIQVVSLAELLLERIQKEIGEQKKRESEVDQLAVATDPLHFLQICQALDALAPVPSPMTAVSMDGLTFDSATKALCDFKTLLQEVCQEGFVSIYEKVREVVMMAPPILPVHTDVTMSSPVVQPVVEIQAAANLSPGLDQSPVSPLNPFLNPGPVGPMFVLSTFGSKMSTGTRQRNLQRRSHARKK
ncbi:finTRIM family, member 67 [Festucalex cinctus]